MGTLPLSARVDKYECASHQKKAACKQNEIVLLTTLGLPRQSPEHAHGFTLALSDTRVYERRVSDSAADIGSLAVQHLD